jgi:fatty-acyl-CoA synthase
VTINPAFQPPELLHNLNKVQVNALVCGSGSYYEMVLQLIPELSSCSETDIRSAHLPALKMLILISDRKFP